MNYDALDPFKRAATEIASETAGNLLTYGMKELAWTRGESAYVLNPGEQYDFYLAHVEEGLGTKNLVADKFSKFDTEECRTFYDVVAQCTVAMIVNDLITVGALPVSCAMHVASGSSKWFEDADRSADLIKGWKRACDLAGCAWAGGETPTLKGMIDEQTVVLAGSAVGIIRPKERLITPRIQNGDAIILLESSGIHANGLTLAREIAEEFGAGYNTLLENETKYGEAILKPTVIYVPFIRACQKAGLDIHYAVNITGHGWRKLMRAIEPFVYRVEAPPKPQPVFDFIQEKGEVTDREMWGNYNMGAGFAVYVHPDDAYRTVKIAESVGIKAWNSGTILKDGNNKRVEIPSKDLVYEGKTLTVR